jgi:hypothetical protein
MFLKSFYVNINLAVYGSQLMWFWNKNICVTIDKKFFDFQEEVNIFFYDYSVVLEVFKLSIGRSTPIDGNDLRTACISKHFFG